MRGRRLDSLTGLRAIAAFAVFWHHAAVVSWTAHIDGQGLTGVSFFFLLSGFVLTWAHDEQVTAATFYRRRFARIYPAYIVVWIGTAVLASHVGFETAPPAGTVIIGALLLQAWSPSQHVYFAVFPAAWSLSAEAFFYLSFPLWARRLTRQRDWRLVQLAVTGIAAVFAIAAIGQMLGPGGDPLTNASGVGAWLVRILPATRVIEFALGAILSLAVRRDVIPRISLRVACAACVAAYAAAGTETLFSSSAITLLPFMLVIVAAAQADLGQRRTPLSSRWIVWCGEVSYCFYLVHQPVIESFQVRAHGLPGRVFVELFVSVAAAAALHYAIERPLERLIRGRNSAVVAATDART